MAERTQQFSITRFAQRAVLRAIVASVLLLLVPRVTLARQDSTIGSRWTDARGAAMGDAYIAFADGVADSLFYNPAGLGNIRRGKLEPFTLQLGPGPDYLGSVGLASWKLPLLSSYLPTLVANDGTRHNLKTSLFSGFAFKGLAVGLMGNAEFSARVSGDNLTYSTQYQLIPTAGFGLPLAHGFLRLGYSIQWVHELSGTATVPVTTATPSYLDGMSRGSAFSHTLGASLTLPLTMLPSFHLVVRNALGAQFSSSALLIPAATNSPGVPTTTPMSFDVAAAAHPKFGHGLSLKASVQLRDVTNVSAVDLLSRLVAGFEFSAQNSFLLRAGYGSGHPALGFAVKRPKGEFGISWYSEGLSPTWRVDRQMVLMFQIKVTPF